MNKIKYVGAIPVGGEGIVSLTRHVSFKNRWWWPLPIVNKRDWTFPRTGCYEKIKVVFENGLVAYPPMASPYDVISGDSIYFIEENWTFLTWLRNL